MGILLTVLIAAAVAVPLASAAVSSIDLGSEWLKVAAVHLAPGRVPIGVAINEMSKRKSPALAALADGNRLAGEEAAGITARHPSKVFARARDLLAKPFPYAHSLAQSLFLPYHLVPDARGAAAVRADDGQVYSFEEIVAMVLHYAAGLADAHVGAPVPDAVVTVPPYFGQAERRALTQAAQLAGINVLALINEHAGAALQYGIDKDFSNESRHVIFYDMGSGSAYAALVYFSAYNTKEFGKTVSVNQFQVKKSSHCYFIEEIPLLVIALGSVTDWKKMGIFFKLLLLDDDFTICC
jgi:hypoxia up-regulated 1